MTEALALGVAYGLSAGIAPGPLLALVITTSLRDGWRAGALVAVAPLLTDIPIIVVSLSLLGQLSDSSIGVIGMLGSLLVIRIGVDTVRDAGRTDPMADAARVKPPKQRRRRRPATVNSLSLRRGATVNALSPHPYLFWLTIGGPQMVRFESTDGLLAAGAFAVAFVALLAGCKVLVALVVGAARRKIGGRVYRAVLACTGVILVALGGVLAFESIRLLV